MQADIAWGQVQGNRPSQQDYATCLSWPNDLHLLILADGLGGHSGGDVASATAVESFRDAFVATAPKTPTRDRLLGGLQEANLAVFDRAQASPELLGMGTTIVAVVIEHDSLSWVSVGDSALWLVRDRAIRRLNEDHSVGGMLDKRVEACEISAEEAASAPGRSELVEALMGNDVTLVDAPRDPVRLDSGDVVILASDGIATCDHARLVQIVTGVKQPSAEVVDAVLDAVDQQAGPGQDNATVIVAQINRNQTDE